MAEDDPYDDDEGTHRVVGKHHRVRYEGVLYVYPPGERVTPPESALQAHPDRFERVADDEALDEADEPPADPDRGGDDPTEMTVRELREWADSASRDEVEAALDAEQARDDPRTTAVGALEARLGELDTRADADADTDAEEE